MEATEIKLDEVMRDRMKAILPFSLKAVDSFTPEIYGELPEEFRPSFKIRPFTVGEKKEITTAASRGGMQNAEQLDKIRKVLVGWEKLFDSATLEVIEYRAETDGGCERKLFDALPQCLMIEILNHAIKISGLLSAEKLSLKS